MYFIGSGSKSNNNLFSPIARPFLAETSFCKNVKCKSRCFSFSVCFSGNNVAIAVVKFDNKFCYVENISLYLVVAIFASFSIDRKKGCRGVS